jgi:hypothetical protein
MLEKPLSDNELQLIIESMEGLSKMGPTEEHPHMQKAYLDYFNQLKNLVIEYRPKDRNFIMYPDEK